MLNKVCPRKDLYHYGEKHDGFFIDGANFDDCYKQLIQSAKSILRNGSIIMIVE